MTERLDLRALGWDERFAKAAAAWPDLLPSRVCRESKGAYRVLWEGGESPAEAAGKLWHEAAGGLDLPAVGDWVMTHGLGASERVPVVHAVLPRRSRFVRRLPGRVAREQVVASNVDTVFLVTGLDGDFNPRRIERYLVTAWDSGARPVVLLNKADVAQGLADHVAAVERVAPGVPVHALSASTGDGLAALDAYLVPAQTVAFLGSSGVGKTTIVNRLLGAGTLRTAEVRRHDQRGKHTTTHRQLVVLPCGALALDTPGLRELQLWDVGGGLDAAFDDVAGLAERCQFRDCRHRTEPGCEVRAALADGRLDPARHASWEKLRGEIDHLERSQDVQASLAEKRRWKSIHKAAKRHQPRK